MTETLTEMEKCVYDYEKEAESWNLDPLLQARCQNHVDSVCNAQNSEVQKSYQKLSTDMRVKYSKENKDRRQKCKDFVTENTECKVDCNLIVIVDKESERMLSVFNCLQDFKKKAWNLNSLAKRRCEVHVKNVCSAREFNKDWYGDYYYQSFDSKGQEVIKQELDEQRPECEDFVKANANCKVDCNELKLAHKNKRDTDKDKMLFDPPSPEERFFSALSSRGKGADSSHPGNRDTGRDCENIDRNKKNNFADINLKASVVIVLTVLFFI